MLKNKKDETEKLYSLWRLKWPFLTGAVVVIGGVMAFGIVAYFAFYFNDKNSIAMLGMIVPMAVVYAITLELIDWHVRKRMKKLVDGIHEVAEGNLEYRMPATGWNSSTSPKKGIRYK